MVKKKFKFAQCIVSNKFLIGRGLLTLQLDVLAILSLSDLATLTVRDHRLRYADIPVIQENIDSLFSLLTMPHRCQTYACAGRPAKCIDTSSQTPAPGGITHMVSDSTRFNAFGDSG